MMQSDLHNFPCLQGGSPLHAGLKIASIALHHVFVLYLIRKLFGIYPFIQSSAAAAATAAATAEAQRIVPSGPHQWGHH